MKYIYYGYVLLIFILLLFIVYKIGKFYWRHFLNYLFCVKISRWKKEIERPRLFFVLIGIICMINVSYFLSRVSLSENFSFVYFFISILSLLTALFFFIYPWSQKFEKIFVVNVRKKLEDKMKGKDRQEIEFFGKFILCSNNETSFIHIDKEEIRYWVIKVFPFSNTLNCSSEQFFERLRLEVPAFLYFLLNRSFHTKNDSRMWFTPKQIETEALIKLKRNYKSTLEKEMLDILQAIFEDQDLEQLCFQINDVICSLSNLNRKAYSLHKIRDILVSSWGLSATNSSYVRYIIFADGTISKNQHKGRYYELTKKRFDEIYC